MFFSKIHWFPPVQQSINAQKYPKIAKKNAKFGPFSLSRGPKMPKKNFCDFFPKIQCICDIVLKTKCS